MNKLLCTAAFSALAVIAAPVLAHAECYWAGNHWDCPAGYIYPKSYPPGTTFSNGVYSRPMYPGPSDVNLATQPVALGPSPLQR